MKLLVAVKRVLDYKLQPRVRSDGSGIDTQGLKHSLNPFDEIALEAALRLHEAGAAKEVVVVSIGDESCQEMLRAALAMGADRGLLVHAEHPPPPLGVARVLAELAKREQPDLILLGKQAIDDDHGQTGPMLAALLDWPQGTFASAINVKNNLVEVTREIDGGLERLELTLPAVVTTDLRLNEPRYASLPDIMKARGKPLERVEFDALDIEPPPEVTILRTIEPPRRPTGTRVADAEELVRRLHDEARVL